jgi:hypothetical protein
MTFVKQSLSSLKRPGFMKKSISSDLINFPKSQSTGSGGESRNLRATKKFESGTHKRH